MEKIFICHSSEDKELLETIKFNLAQVNIKAYLAEELPYERPPHPKIDRMIDESTALFLLLTPSISKSEHTKAWVRYEVDQGKNRGKKVYVLEEWNNWLMNFPVLYLTDYIIYDSTQKEHWIAIQRIAVEEVKKHEIPPAAFAGGVIGGLLGMRRGPLAALLTGGLGFIAGKKIAQKLNAVREQRNFPYRIMCPYPTCGVSFNLYSDVHRFPCPCCRQTIVW